MFNVIQGGHDTLDAMNYVQPSASTQNFFAQKLQQWGQVAQQTGSTFMQNVVTQVQELAKFDLAAKANALAHKNHAFWHGDNIRPLRTLGELQQAPNMMVRWMMAQPDYRRRYLDNTCEAYGNKFVNYQGNDVGIDQQDYRTLYNGTIVTSNDKQYYRNFMEEHDEQDVNLSVEQRFDILESHELFKAHLDCNDRDPGDPWNGRL